MGPGLLWVKTVVLKFCYRVQHGCVGRVLGAPCEQCGAPRGAWPDRLSAGEGAATDCPQMAHSDSSPHVTIHCSRRGPEAKPQTPRNHGPALDPE